MLCLDVALIWFCFGGLLGGLGVVYFWVVVACCVLVADVVWVVGISLFVCLGGVFFDCIFVFDYLLWVLLLTLCGFVVVGWFRLLFWGWGVCFCGLLLGGCLGFGFGWVFVLGGFLFWDFSV